MDTVSVTVLLLVLYLGGISNYTQKGLGTMGAPFQQLGMFLLNKAPAGVVDLFNDEDGRGSRTWMQFGIIWLVIAGVLGFLRAWHIYDPTALDSLSNVGWSWDDGSSMDSAIASTLKTALLYILVGGGLVAHSRASGGRLASESNASMVAMLLTTVPLVFLLIDFLTSLVGIDASMAFTILGIVVKVALWSMMLVNLFITSSNRDGPVSVPSWFLLLGLSTYVFGTIGSSLGEALGWTQTTWICDVLVDGWAPLALMFAVGYHVLSSVTKGPIWSGSLTKASMFLLFLTIPPFLLMPTDSDGTLLRNLAAILVTLGMLPVLAGAINMIATMRNDTAAVVKSPGALAVAAAAFLLPLYVILSFFFGLNVMVGDGSMSTLASHMDTSYLYTIGGLFALGALFHSYPLAASRDLAGNSSNWAVWLVIIGGVSYTAIGIMAGWVSDVTAGLEDTDGVIDAAAQLNLIGAVAFYAITIGFIIAANTIVRTLLVGTPRAAAAGGSSDISTYGLVEGSTSIRELLGRGVGLDTTLVIGESEDESEGGYTVIDVSAELHNDSVDEFPVKFDADLVALTKWLCARGTTTAQFFAWADVDSSGEIDLYEFSNALRIADIADLPPWDLSKLVNVMDINSDGRLNLPELDIALLNIRNTLGIEFIANEAPEAPAAPEAPEAADDDDSEEVDKPSDAALGKMKKAELVELAESMGLDTKGTKAVLVERISKA